MIRKIETILISKLTLEKIVRHFHQPMMPLRVIRQFSIIFFFLFCFAFKCWATTKGSRKAREMSASKVNWVSGMVTCQKWECFTWQEGSVHWGEDREWDDDRWLLIYLVNNICQIYFKFQQCWNNSFQPLHSRHSFTTTFLKFPNLLFFFTHFLSKLFLNDIWSN